MVPGLLYISFVFLLQSQTKLTSGWISKILKWQKNFERLCFLGERISFPNLLPTSPFPHSFIPLAGKLASWPSVLVLSFGIGCQIYYGVFCFSFIPKTQVWQCKDRGQATFGNFSASWRGRGCLALLTIMLKVLVTWDLRVWCETGWRKCVGVKVSRGYHERYKSFFFYTFYSI